MKLFCYCQLIRGEQIRQGRVVLRFQQKKLNRMKRIIYLIVISVVITANALPVSIGECGTWLPESIATSGDPLFYPTYPGGEKALNKFIRKNLVYPEMLKQLEAEGECTMHFTVHEDGSISDISATECRLTHYNPAKMMNHSEEEAIKKECARQMAKEGLRLIRKMKRWNPAIINDAPTEVHHSLKLTFSYEYAER